MAVRDVDRLLGMATQDPPSALRTAFDEARATVESAADAITAYRLATALRTEADALVTEAATLRAATALRVLESEGLSLGQLAERLGTSKARADQLVRAAKRPAQVPTGR